jgi:hypothetical protein
MNVKLRVAHLKCMAGGSVAGTLAAVLAISLPLGRRLGSELFGWTNRARVDLLCTRQHAN